MKLAKKSNLKSEVIALLTPIFGEGLRDNIERMYDEKEEEELIEVANDMLTPIMGEKNTRKIIANLLKNHHKLKKKYVGA